MGLPDEGLETLRQATRQVGEGSNADIVSDIYTTMGDLLQERGEVDEACSCYESALKYTPTDILVLNNYAYLLAQEERELEKAELMSRRTIEAEPNNATYLDTYAWILYKLKRYEEASSYIVQAIEEDPEPSDVLYEHAGDIYLRLGNKVKALDYWYKALNLQRKNGAIDKNLNKKIKELNK
jgi:tetratricopeptide (TPR) repeat protein